MAKIEINPGKLKVAAEELQTIANDYNKLMIDLYNKIANIESQEIWVSENDNGASKKFINNVLRDKVPALALGNDIKTMGNKISGYASSIMAATEGQVAPGSLSKVKIDTDIISGTVIPSAKKTVEDIESTLKIATKVNFPDGGNDWSSVINDLNECKIQANNYYNWITGINEKLINLMTNATEDIKGTSITEVPKRSLIVK